MPDNSNLARKVALRIYALREARIVEARVLDLYAGRGLVWENIKQSVDVTTYVACDRRKLQRGQIHFSDIRRLARSFDLTRFNVIDIDAYGEPWEVFENIYNRAAPGSCVFLTQGTPNYSIAQSKLSLSKMGILPGWHIPKKKELTLLEYKWFLNSGHRVRRLWKSSAGSSTYFAALF